MPNRPYRLLIGIDEAGYGPNLGPLVIGCTVWLIESEATDLHSTSVELETLLDRLKPVFQGKPIRSTSKHIPLGDSKAIHSKDAAVDSLWQGVFFWLNRLGIIPSNEYEFLQALATDFLVAEEKKQPWYQFVAPNDSMPELKSMVPIIPPASRSRANAATTVRSDAFAFSDETKLAAEQIIDTLNLRLLGLSSKIIDEASFNDGVERYGNKAGLLSYESLSLALKSIEEFSSNQPWMIDGRLQSIHVYCDKHGGRNRYQSPLMQVMPDRWFQAEHESTLRSDYHSKWDESIPLHWSFIAKGDRLLGSALASMVAKLLREKLMDRFNAFWKSHFPEIRPTAGYPVDALRFRSEIESKAKELQLPEKLWWRCR